MSLMEPSFDPTVFTKNRQRLPKHDVARQFFDEVVWACLGSMDIPDESGQARGECP
jgi:hypothetical protein